MHHRAKDITGQTQGYLTALRYLGSDGKNSVWLFNCSACGGEYRLAASEFGKLRKRGVTASCGCMRGKTISAKRATHGMSKHPAFAVWRSMVDRCRLPSHQAWANYGGRGITVCAEWQDSFEAFWRDMGPSYSSGLTLERVDNSKGYSAENCRWATYREQANNKRRTVFVQVGREQIPASVYAERYGLGLSTLYYRLDQGLTHPELSAPVDSRNRFSTSSTPGRDHASP